VGTPVVVTGSGPDYQTYLKESAEKAKANAAKLAAAKKKAVEAAAAAAAATTLAPDDPNGPKGGVVTPPLGAPAGTLTPPLEVRPAEPVNAPPAGN
jgi:septal ring factor EnvC (AmiA/AmiB activator)